MVFTLREMNADLLCRLVTWPLVIVSWCMHPLLRKRNRTKKKTLERQKVTARVKYRHMEGEKERGKEAEGEGGRQVQGQSCDLHTQHPPRSRYYPGMQHGFPT